MDFYLWADLAYLFSASLFIIGIKKMSTPKTARTGNLLAASGMLVAIVVTLLDQQLLSYELIIVGMIIGTLIGAITSRVVQMTAMPQMVAIFNGFGGLASALVAWAEYSELSGTAESFVIISIVLGTLIGAVTFSGSFIAYGKLQGFIFQQPFTYPFQNIVNLLIAFVGIGSGICVILNPGIESAFWALLGLSLLVGILIVLPIGGADMPVIISLLNSFSGVAAAMTGFVLMNKVLIVSGSLVGAAGLILTQIMCKAMNRSLSNVMFGAFGKVEPSSGGGKQDNTYVNVKSTTPEEASMILDASSLVLIVPGYGLAVSRAQHSIKELANVLQDRGVEVRYAIHPVAGRMPGHMNVLLAEAEVPYDQLFEMDQINHEFDRADAVIVVGANDVTNPAAREEPGSPIYGMPILNVDKAKTVIIIKRSLSPGFAGIKNPLFEMDNSMMLFGDAKAMIDGLSKEIKNL